MFIDHTVLVSVICYVIVYYYFIGIEDIPILIIWEYTAVSSTKSDRRPIIIEQPMIIGLNHVSK